MPIPSHDHRTIVVATFSGPEPPPPPCEYARPPPSPSSLPLHATLELGTFSVVVDGVEAWDMPVRSAVTLSLAAYVGNVVSRLA
jgi:hypothetical protein